MTGAWIDLVDVCGGRRTGWTTVYDDTCFRRRTARVRVRPDLTLEIVADGLRGSHIQCFHISLVADKDDVVGFQFADMAVAEHDQGRLIADRSGNRMFWMPADPVLREYDAHGRVISETTADVEAAPEARGWRFLAGVKARHRLQVGLVLFDADIAGFRDELVVFRPLELRPVARNTWFHYEGPADVWRYFVDGVFLHKSSPRRSGFQSQNIAYTLYFYLSYLACQTRKRVYRTLADVIAYCTMLSLPSDARWRHGIWTDGMETHTAHQVSGIHVLLDGFERTRKQIFLDKAQAAADYLISIADRMHGNGTWFLHDTLECDIDAARLHYGDIGPSEAFGKSLSNTLTLNTHISVMTVLCGLQQVVRRADYDRCVDEGLVALRSVLRARAANSVYSLVYGLRDRLVRRSAEAPTGFAAKLTIRYEQILRRRLLPFLKQRFPRLAMPDGYVERDLTHTALSDFYHLINMEDMLRLYGCCPDEWLGAMIRKSVDFTLRSRLVERMGPAGFGAGTFLGVLLLYGALIDERCLGHLVRHIRLFREASAPLPVKILSSPVIADPSSAWSVDNADLIVLASADQGRFSAVIMNPTRETQTGRLTCPLDTNAWRLVNAENRGVSAAESLRVPPGGYVRIVKNP
jgi:hypothetical protein